MEFGKQKLAEERLLSSGATFNSSFNLNTLPPHDISIISSRHDQIFSTFNVKGSELIEFVIPPSNVCYTNLAKTFMYLRLKVVKSDGTDLEPDSPTSIGQLMFSTLFRSVEIFVNDICISNTTGNYAFTSYFHRILNATRADLNTNLICEGYAKSTSSSPIAPDNEMYKTLLAKTRTKYIEFYSVLNHSLFEIRKQFPINTKFTIRLRLNSPKFCLLSTASTDTLPFTHKVSVEQCYLDVCRNVVNSKIQNLHDGILSKNQKIQFPFRERETLSYMIPTGNITHISETLLSKVPSFALICLLESTAYYGKENLSPLSFFHNDLVSCNFLINGERQLQNVKFSVTDKEYMKLYRSLFNFQNSENQQMLMSMESFIENGSFIIPIHYTDDSFKLDRTVASFPADIKVSLQFKEATKKDYVCLFYFTYDRILSIDRDSNVFLD